MTLSHRWGRVEYRQLTSKTREEFQRHIDTTTLPSAFREAGIIARKLQVNYLWIDSLCIEQDSDLQDWHREAPNMHLVYGNSFLNLAATLSPETGTQSLFDTNEWKPFVPMLFQANDVKAKELKLGIRVRTRRSFRALRHRKVYKARRFRVSVIPRPYFLMDGDTWEFEVEETPLSTRAWVYQERLLAPRVLHFGKRQLVWECKEHTAMEMFPAGLPVALAASTLPEIVSATLTSRINDVSHASFRGAWHDLVGRYSRCFLTRLSDKLIALQGVVSQIEHARGDEYLAGTWKSTMITDLPFIVLEGLRSDRSQTLYRAPSWSWLSLEAEIQFPEAVDPSGYYATIHAYPSREQAGSSVLQAQGALSVSGILLPVSDLEVEGDLLKSFCVAGFRFDDGWTPNATHFDMDSLEADRSLVIQQKVFVLPLYYTKTQILGITLARCKTHPTNFRRIGAVQIECARIGSMSRQADDGWLVVSYPSLKKGVSIICHYNDLALQLIGSIQNKLRGNGPEIITIL